MKRGITFNIPNQFGRFAADILQPFPISPYTWFIGDGEAYIEFKEDTDTDLFPQNQRIIQGQELRQRLEGNPYYMIFAELKAFPGGMVTEINTYEEYLESSCELVLLIADCSYVTLYCKDPVMLEALYQQAVQCGFHRVDYVTDENDARTGLSV
ncbi:MULTISPECIES: DUF2691 family protein [Bacillus]|nr:MULTISPECIES: DUF2691 family protein [Bacillus]APA04042.1 hypothetical protein BK055_16560 [Bacillus velezensis]AVB08981.1 DUF2691 domain-containing protein [Bacillus velezensis]AWQ14615.1 DUF2691 domain-containing protein [Bacillus velezensis]MCM8507267.1 DUF2691 family protein [Bacillus amyloliquefaciens]MCR6616569.1 DUF2691 family protein [Bacillus amyloliquefaciens]